MTLRHLRIFAAVCEEKSVTGAAEKLYMSQPAVSLAIKELEEGYGIRLFDRLTRRLQMTQEGARMLEYAAHIVSLFDEMEKSMRNPDAAGEIKIGGSLTIGACLLPGYLQALAKQCPALKPRVTIDNTNRIATMVRAGELDVGLVEGAVDDAALLSRNFMKDSLVAVCAPSHPFAGRESVELDAFLAQPLLLRERGSGTRELFQSAVTLLGKTLSPAWESISTTALIRAVEAGEGVSVLPERLVADAVAAGRLSAIALRQPALARDFRAIYHKNKYMSAGMRALIDIAVASGSGCQRANG